MIFRDYDAVTRKLMDLAKKSDGLNLLEFCYIYKTEYYSAIKKKCATD